MYKKEVIVLNSILLIIISSSVVFSVDEDDNRIFNSNDPNKFDYDNGDYSTIDWTRVDQSRIPPHNIHKIPPQHVKIEKIKDVTKLKGPQLAYKGTNSKHNFEKLPDFTKANREELNKALRKTISLQIREVREGEPIFPGRIEIAELGNVIIIYPTEINEEYLKTIFTDTDQLQAIPYGGDKYISVSSILEGRDGDSGEMIPFTGDQSSQLSDTLAGGSGELSALLAGGSGGQGEYVPFTGEKGETGADGEKGLPGVDSTVNGEKGEPGADSTVAGPDGEKGEPGEDSTVNGEKGEPGADSTVNGEKGGPGEKGEPGADSTVNGEKGIPGADGAKGAEGAEGGPGQYGSSYIAAEQTATTPGGTNTPTGSGGTRTLAWNDPWRNNRFYPIKTEFKGIVNGQYFQNGNFQFDSVEQAVLTLPRAENLSEFILKYNQFLFSGNNSITNGSRIENRSSDDILKQFLVENNYKIEQLVVINAKGIKYENGFLTAEHSDSFIKDNSIITNVNSLVSGKTSFYVEEADSILSGCVTVNDIENSTFTIYGNAIEIASADNVSLEIVDCSFNKVEFKSDGGRAFVNKESMPTYAVEKGTLTFEEDEYQEKVEANNAAIVELDPNFGFACMLIIPPGTYWYNHEELKKDFGINIPANANQYNLCLRKNEIQSFESYDGLVDFTKNSIILNKIVNYLKYSFKNNEIASLLMYNLFWDLDDYNTHLKLDEDFFLIDSIKINEKENRIRTTKTITEPSNYYVIAEHLIKNERHRLVKIDFRLNKEDLTQNRISVYETDYFIPKVDINNNILTQNNNENNIDILTPEHEEINKILN